MKELLELKEKTEKDIIISAQELSLIKDKNSASGIILRLELINSKRFLKLINIIYDMDGRIK